MSSTGKGLYLTSKLLPKAKQAKELFLTNSKLNEKKMQTEYQVNLYPFSFLSDDDLLHKGNLSV